MVAPKLICPCPGDCKCDFIWGKGLYKYNYIRNLEGFPTGSVVKNLPANAGDPWLIP